MRDFLQTLSSSGHPTGKTAVTVELTARYLPWLGKSRAACSQTSPHTAPTPMVTVLSVQCTVYSVQCTVYSVQCSVYSVQCTVYCTHTHGHCTAPTRLVTVLNPHPRSPSLYCSHTQGQMYSTHSQGHPQVGFNLRAFAL